MVEPSANRKISCNSSKEFNRKKWCYLFAVIYDILFVKLNEEHFYILRHQMMHYPTVKDNVNLEFLSTPHCKIRNSSYEFAVLSKNKILRDFWETQSLKNGLNRRFWKRIARLWLRHLRFESLYLCQHLGTFVFRGFFMPEYCFLRRCSGNFSLP